MRKIQFRLPAPALALAVAAALSLAAAIGLAQSAPIVSGWSLLQQGEGVGTIEQNASNPSNPAADGKLLKLAIAKSAPMQKGRVGATQSANVEVKDGSWYDINFSAMTQMGTVGLVFSLESADGKVLARTTLPEIGRGRRGGGGRRGARGGRGARGAAGSTTATATISTTATAAAAPSPTPAPPAAWPKYLVSLHARASDPKAHLTIVPIEPATIWIDGLVFAERQSSESTKSGAQK